MKTLIMVIDGLGIGEAPDAKLFGDEGSNTLGNTVLKTGVELPNLQKLGIFNIDGLEFLNKQVKKPCADYGKMQELSMGKDTTTGHFEMMGCVLPAPFPTFPKGFPKNIVKKLEKEFGIGILGNCVASGTEIIKVLGKEHIETKKPIVYTSADSVLQIATHISVYSINELYELCEKARKIMQGKFGVSRVIARPFATNEKGEFYRTEDRKDFALLPPSRVIMQDFVESGLDSVAIGKINDIFSGLGITKHLPAHNNQQSLAQIFVALKMNVNGLIFANLVDTDMLFGHRNDAVGYANALKEIDENLPTIIEQLEPGDRLILTGDHGCDPTTISTDHSREFTPLIVFEKGQKSGKNLGTKIGFNSISKMLKNWFKI